MKLCLEEDGEKRKERSEQLRDIRVASEKGTAAQCCACLAGASFLKMCGGKSISRF